MREIKFRAWSKSWQSMIPWEHLLYLMDGKYIARREPVVAYSPTQNPSVTGVVYERKGNPFRDDDILFMQFIGLKDKNGKEIYEGDVVTYKVLEGFACDEENWEKDNRAFEAGPSVVKFSDGEFFPREQYRCVEDGFYSWRHFGFEVVGNIYESPDLLK